ncbi:metallophosphoesterase [Oscillochloris trichoides DG-6]|uniref:Metallophosphoesterase n=1 Tax=Oscillochloris trichoides DG-6 TaxID=765420 RepID=E1IDN3_9CHLR|nr:metallophosphoesterase family protein [Oscillochloris trichoides]EFO80741.1 metallophosphoesterase [Oscillochloris trichoides DG-6]
MRIVLLSDIHSNLVALEAVIDAAGSFDALWCIGDTIGYGPRPNECVELMRKHAQIAITGNHDLACLGRIDLRDFNPDARKANLWNGKQLTPENRAWLEPLPPSFHVDKQFLLAHGSPREPVWEYLLMPEQAAANFEYFPNQVCVIGHSHIQLGFRMRHGSEHAERFLPEPGETIELHRSTRYFINPGSVGQPRDQDPRAAFAVFDTAHNSIRFHRVTYDVAKTQHQMQEAGLPYDLIHRLKFGR